MKTWQYSVCRVVLVLLVSVIGGILTLAAERAVPEFRGWVERNMGRQDCDCTAVIASASVWFPQGPSWAENQPPSTVVRETKPPS